jgi:glucose-6-phosphate isomerase
MAVVSEAKLGGRTLFKQTISGCFSDAIGDGGLMKEAFAGALGRSGAALAKLKQSRRDGSLPLLAVGDDLASVDEIYAAYNRLADGAKTIVFFGTGGSGLGGQTIAQFGGWSIPGVGGLGQDSKEPGKSARPPITRFYDNLDPFTLQSALGRLDLARTRFVVTSKSGGTPETLSQALATLQAVKAAGLEARIPDMFLGITEPGRAGVKNGLRDLLEHHGAPCLDHHDGIGGRFAVLTNVGLLPAVARGADPARILKGARSVVDALENAVAPSDFAPLIGATLAVELANTRGIKVQVMMPYADRLGRLGDWYVQLWAESLGKDGKGTTPLGCLGPLDQHSQLQLFMDGPREHYLTFVRLPMAGAGPRIDARMAEIAGIDVLAGKTIGDLVAAQTHAVPEALMQAGRPVRIFDVPALDEEAMGAILMHFMLETILAGWLFGVDPFDQPAVELGKILTRQHLAGET